MTGRLEALVDELAQDLHDHDCALRGVPTWPLHLTPHRQTDYQARAAALMPRISTELAAAHLAGEHEVRVQWHQFGGGPYPLPNPNAPAAYAWPTTSTPHHLWGEPDGLPCIAGRTDPAHVHGAGCTFHGTGVPQDHDTEAVQR